MSTPTRTTRNDAAASTLTSAAYVGTGTAALGAAFAAAHATMRGRPAVLWSAAAGLQCFALGSTFWFTRSILLNSTMQGHFPSRKEELMYSTLAGSFAGMVGGAIRGRGNIIPGAVILGLVGLAGQTAFTSVAAVDFTSRDRRPILDRLSDSKWWPLKSISDEEYEADLTEKIIGLQADIAIIDDKIANLRQQQKAMFNAT